MSLTCIEIIARAPYINYQRLVLRFWLTYKISPKFCLKFWRNFCQYFASFPPSLPPKQLVEQITYTSHYFLSNIFIFVQKIKSRFFPKILNIVAKFRRDSIFQAKIFAKLFRKYRRNFRYHNTTRDPTPLQILATPLFKGAENLFQLIWNANILVCCGIYNHHSLIFTRCQ